MSHNHQLASSFGFNTAGRKAWHERSTKHSRHALREKSRPTWGLTASPTRLSELTRGGAINAAEVEQAHLYSRGDCDGRPSRPRPDCRMGCWTWTFAYRLKWAARE